MFSLDQFYPKNLTKSKKLLAVKKIFAEVLISICLPLDVVRIAKPFCIQRAVHAPFEKDIFLPFDFMIFTV